jgi:hypothetical protein
MLTSISPVKGFHPLDCLPSRLDTCKPQSRPVIDRETRRKARSLLLVGQGQCRIGENRVVHKAGPATCCSGPSYVDPPHIIELLPYSHGSRRRTPALLHCSDRSKTSAFAFPHVPSLARLRACGAARETVSDGERRGFFEELIPIQINPFGTRETKTLANALSSCVFASHCQEGSWTQSKNLLCEAILSHAPIEMGRSTSTRKGSHLSFCKTLDYLSIESGERYRRTVMSQIAKSTKFLVLDLLSIILTANDSIVIFCLIAAIVLFTAYRVAY